MEKVRVVDCGANLTRVVGCQVRLNHAQADWDERLCQQH